MEQNVEQIMEQNVEQIMEQNVEQIVLTLLDIPCL